MFFRVSAWCLSTSTVLEVVGLLVMLIVLWQPAPPCARDSWNCWGSLVGASTDGVMRKIRPDHSELAGFVHSRRRWARIFFGGNIRRNSSLVRPKFRRR